MKEKPILLDTLMVQATLAGLKTETRLPVRCSHKWAVGFNIVRNASGEIVGALDYDKEEQSYDNYTPPPCNPGDVLWVREAWAPYAITNGFLYRAWVESEPEKSDDAMRAMGLKWKSPISMPRKAARLFLLVKDVHIERLWDITEESARAEGFYPGWQTTGTSTPAATARQAFMWYKLAERGPGGWSENPWVWVLQYERTDEPKD